jgi:hypothetical protein
MRSSGQSATLRVEPAFGKVLPCLQARNTRFIAARMRIARAQKQWQYIIHLFAHASGTSRNNQRPAEYRRIGLKSHGIQHHARHTAVVNLAARRIRTFQREVEMLRTQTAYSNVMHDQITRWLLAGGAVGPLLFIAVFLIEGATRPGYSAWRNQVSELELSNQGWEQIANFLICGMLCSGFAVGLWRIWRKGRASVWGPLLIGLFGLCLMAAGVFLTDPGRQYPPGAPLKGDPQTWHGWVHGINGLVLFNIVLPSACFVLARRLPSSRGTVGRRRTPG